MRFFHTFALLTPLILVSPSWAYDVQINVTGSIINTTCDVDTGSTGLNVLMGDRPLSELNSTVGATSPAIPFAIKLVNCSEAATGVNIEFTATASSADPSLIKLDDGGATGIGIEILDDESHAIPVNVASKNYPLVASTDNTLNFFARYKTESLPVTPGDANAMGTFTLTYL